MNRADALYDVLYGGFPEGDLCENCGGDDLMSVTSAESYTPIKVVCPGCGWSARPAQPVRFRLWRGRPVHMIDPRWVVPQAVMREEPGWEDQVEDPIPMLTVWCGPAANRPMPPTPADILTAAGLDYLTGGL